jgi:hypothetical protein
MSQSQLSSRENAIASPGEMTRAQKYERVAFNFCKMGTTGLLCWLLTPPLFVLVMSLAIIGLYGKALGLGLVRSRCFLRKPLLIIGFWSVVVIADATWLIYSHPYW